MKDRARQHALLEVHRSASASSALRLAEEARLDDTSAYQISIPLFGEGFDLELDAPIMILHGDDGVGKSALI